MKVTVVPAQVTTVEDRIMGSLSFSQVIFLVVPIFVGAALFALLPPAMGNSPYKYIIMGIIALFSGMLAIRIKGKILALWLVTILRYNLRPKYYLFNKNTAAWRNQYEHKAETPKKKPETVKAKKTATLPKLNVSETIKILETIENPASKLRFETTKKGGLSVRLTEIQD